MLAVVFIRFVMKNLFNHFRNSILAVFFTALIPLLFCVFDKDAIYLVFFVLAGLPILLLIDFLLWVVFYKKENEREIPDLDLLLKELDKEKNKIPVNLKTTYK